MMRVVPCLHKNTSKVKVPLFSLGAEVRNNEPADSMVSLWGRTGDLRLGGDSVGCFICDKHSGNVAQPPGGYIYEDEHWMVCHFPAEMALLGQVVIESKRNFLDFTEMTSEETQSYGVLMQKLYSAVREATESERVYNLILLEGVPHFHAHIVPRRNGSDLKGLQLLTAETSCKLNDAVEISEQLRRLLNQEGQIDG